MKPKPFENDILKTWKNNTKAKDFFNELFFLYKYRHWLAHGRYWILKMNIIKFAFNYIYAIAQAITKKLELYK